MVGLLQILYAGRRSRGPKVYGWAHLVLITFDLIQVGRTVLYEDIVSCVRREAGHYASNDSQISKDLFIGDRNPLSFL